MWMFWLWLGAVWPQSAGGKYCANRQNKQRASMMRWPLFLTGVFFNTLLLSVIALPCRALEFANGIEESSWRYEGSRYGCSLVHGVPFYGDAVFQTRAGENSRFKLKPKASRFESGKASLKLKPPAWRHNVETIDLGYVPVDKGLNPVQLNSAYTERLMAELLAGYELELVRAPWYGAEESSKVMISPIGFRDAYARYLDCLADLLPVNFDQVKRTAVYFGSNKFEPLPASQLLKLNNLLRYIQTDASIKAFYIDGHTDSVGTRADNYILAENRAKEVTAFLVAKGISEDKLTVRWHGERYPVASNATVSGRAQNRRVTIRIERDPALIPKGAESKDAEPSDSKFDAVTH